LGIARTGSVYVTMSVTLERYFAIVHPLKHFKVKKYLLPTTILFSVLYNMPKVKFTEVIILSKMYKQKNSSKNHQGLHFLPGSSEKSIFVLVL
jgi:hypothetical protein